MRGYGKAATWDAYTSSLAEQLRPWVHPSVLDRYRAYQDACARLVYLVLAPMTSEPEGVYARCGQAMQVCATLCLAGAQALDFGSPIVDHCAQAVLEAFATTRPMFDAMIAAMPPDVAEHAVEKYEDFAQLVAAVAMADGQGEKVGLTILDALIDGIDAVIAGFAAVRHGEDGQPGVGSSVWNEQARAWARGLGN